MDFYIQNNEKPKTQTEYFTILGKHETLDANDYPVLLNNINDALAKRVHLSNDKIKYWIKIGPHGRIYNPIGLFSEDRANKHIARAGKNEWEFRQVNQKVFDMYLSFLKTKNIAWLNNAERQII